MTAQLSEARSSGRQEFSTTEPDLAIDYLQHAYRTGMRISGPRDGQVYSHIRLDAGTFAIDDARMPLDVMIQQEPFNSLVIATLWAGRFERECGGVSERFVAGDVFIDAEPTLPANARLIEVEGQTVMLDLDVLAQVAATEPGRAPGPIRWTGFRPASPSSAAHWQHTVNYLRGLLANEEAAVQPLIRGNAARLLAATALATFPNTAVVDPTAQERHDATTVTVRRAIAFIEEHAHVDISLADIAAAANVSIRAVQFAFRRHLDTTPMAHVRAVRLDRVHQELLVADPSRGATVTDIATRWGFYNHSRFVTRYRRAYGIAPRHTLHHR
ncbi:MAG TPA: helix-turn-helix transcriptional regulator [Pseudonocardia sp.]|jgi:AraC-like DNA-binding protein|nr:helix-turn-helix transcriptional regulator [Pseudonocardia sp.]